MALIVLSRLARQCKVLMLHWGASHVCYYCIWTNIVAMCGAERPSATQGMHTDRPDWREGCPKDARNWLLHHKVSIAPSWSPYLDLSARQSLFSVSSLQCSDTLVV